MKFTTSLVPLLTIAGAYALPGSALEERQTQQISVVFYSDAGCTVAPSTPVTFIQPAGLGRCELTSAFPTTARGFKVIENTATVALRLYNVTDCSENSTHDDISKGSTGCHNLGPFGATGVHSLKWSPPN